MPEAILIAHTGYSKGGGCEVPFRMILKYEETRFVSRYQRHDDGVEFQGDYSHGTLEEAKRKFATRVSNHNSHYPEGCVSYVGDITWLNVDDKVPEVIGIM